MLKFLKKHPPKESEEREQLKKELFAFQKCVDHGFPSKPSAIAYDPKLKLLAIGTKSGAIRIYGTPGFEVSAAHEGDVSVSNLFFVPDEGYLVSVCSDNSLHFWELNNRNGTCVLEEKKFESTEPVKLKNVSSCCLSTDSSRLFVGTEAGNVHVIDVKSLTETCVISLDSIVQNIPDDGKASPGAVEALAANPASNDQLLIGFSKGLVVLWDTAKNAGEKVFNTSSQLESLAWKRDGEEFISSHNDGSYAVWSINNPSSPKDPAVSPYGPFPCKAINKIQWKVTSNGMLTVLSGGMPRASFGDRHTVSIIEGDNHIVADLSSRVVDFLVLSRGDEKGAADTGRDDPHAIAILAEEELVVLDLESESWPAFRLPYLNSVHSSAITCTHHVSNVPQQLWQKIVDAGDAQHKNLSKREWPINGGKNLSSPPAIKDLLLTGHEDGTVRFWDASTTSLRLLYKLTTSSLFGIPDHVASVEEEEWPPFRKVGTFDPYSDDPRLAIQKLALCPLSETLVTAGAAGQVLIFTLERQERELDLKEIKVNVLNDHEGFVWKGHDALSSSTGGLKQAPGFQPTCIVQLDPPAACTALALHSEWQLVAAGTGQGFALLDYAQKKEVITRCTLNPDELTGTSDTIVARGKALKKSLRESFRRLRRRRSEKNQREVRVKSDESKSDIQHIEETTVGVTDAETAASTVPAETTATDAETAAAAATLAATSETPAPTSETPAPISETPAEETAATSVAPTEGTTTTPAAPSEEGPATSVTPEGTATTPTETAEAAAPSEATPAASGSGDAKPAEQQTETRTAENAVTSIVRSLYFADTFIINGVSHNPSLWVGTSGGHIFVYSLTVPASDKRSTEEVQCVLAKEIKLKHRAPVLGMAVIDGKNNVLPDAFEVVNERAKAPDMEGQHSVIICSEEQLKTFSLPAMKPRWKNKITAVDGTRLRKLNFVTFRREGDSYSESDITCVTNTGDVRVYSVSTLRKQLSSQSLNKEDVNGISSFVFTKDGQGFYLQSPSEFSRITLSTASTTAIARCELELAEGLRPPPEPKPEEAAVEEKTLTRQPTVEVTPASEEQSQEVAGEADAAATSPDDSRMDTSMISADITVDSVKDVLAESEGTIVTSIRTITRTTTSTVSENAASAAQEAQQTVTNTFTNGLAEVQDGVTDVLRETQREVTTRTSEFVTRTTEKVTHTGEEVIKQLSELKMTTAVIEDPSLLKQKLVESTVTTTTTTSDSAVTTNGEEVSVEQ